MGKGSKPRNNHSSSWFANYDDINWNTNPKIMGLTDDQLDMYHALEQDLKNTHGPKLTREQEDELMEQVKKAFQK